MPRSSQNLLVLSIFLAACIILFVHVFVFPLRPNEPQKRSPRLLSEFEQSICASNLKPTRATRRHRCPRDGIVTVAQGGRLGNQMWEYASAWAVARRTGLEPYVPRCIRRTLDDVFEGLSVPPLGYVGHCALRWDEASRSLDGWQRTGQSILLPRFAVLPELVLSWADDIRREFRFREPLNEASRRLLKTAGRRLNGSTPVFIGIHVRRTDYRDYLWRTRGVPLAGAAYFRSAMDYFRAKFAAVAFLVVSDDPAWCRRHLAAADVFVVSAGGGAGGDLALLAACNHSIIDYGTFGVWGAILARGETVLYNISSHSSTRVSQLLPDWHVMN